MLAKNMLSFGIGSKNWIMLVLVLLSGISFAQNSTVTLVGSWEGVMYSPHAPAANGAGVQCVFSQKGEYTCMASRADIGAIRHWGVYRVMANEIELEIKGHEPDSVDMPPTDHLEIVSLTSYSMQTRTWLQGSYVYINFRRSR